MEKFMIIACKNLAHLMIFACKNLAHLMIFACKKFVGSLHEKIGLLNDHCM